MIRELSFAGNELSNITIQEGVTEICKDAFYKNRLSSVVIPTSVKVLNENAFDPSVKIIRK